MQVWRHSRLRGFRKTTDDNDDNNRLRFGYCDVSRCLDFSTGGTLPKTCPVFPSFGAHLGIYGMLFVLSDYLKTKCRSIRK